MVSVIFVEPESAGNIGSIARCMKNFGGGQLILVNPCSLEGAEKMAMHASDVLEKVTITTNLEDALALVDTSVATTSKTEGLARMALTPQEVKAIPGKVGIVIGRESSGLTNEEVERCDFVVYIPTSEEYPVMNAASACCIILYELFRPTEGERKYESNLQKKKILEEFEKIATLIEKRKYRKRIWKIVIKRVITKAFLTDRETTVLLGFFRRIRQVLEATLLQKY